MAYAAGEPIMDLLDLMGRRWAMRIIWELRTDALTFRQLQLRCNGVSSTALNTRLHELRDAEIVENGPAGYQLSGEGQRLVQAYEPLRIWSQRWSRRRNRRSASG
jgi:DNA-binding HxlR family transcriptional regulator